MRHENPLNVYTGPSALQDYYDPDKQPLLPLVEIPGCLNPFRGASCRIFWVFAWCPTQIACSRFSLHLATAAKDPLTVCLALLDDGVRIYAKMMTMLPAHNVKALPGMLAASMQSKR